ncbi:MAG: hypothetical protein EOO04_23760 [Chitinophagaceae bacterium]|nr:MAG: hypothetical protein EOO04_23760 [Chitinophagaceae bacterium]
MKAGNGQYEIKESFYHLDISCRSIAVRFGKPAFNEWTNGDYIRLSSILLHSTSVQISPNTLKRIFGKLKTPERYYPQKATRDALVQYLGYGDWELFVASHPRPIKVADDHLTENKLLHFEEKSKPLPDSIAGNTTKRFPYRYLVAVFAILLILASITWKMIGKSAELSLDGVSFSCKNPEGKNPHSAVFTFQVNKSFTGDINKFSINYGDGRPERPVKNGVVFTHYYEIPGRFFAVLKYDGQPLDTIPIYLRTKGWTATATVERDTMRVYPVAADSLFVYQHLSASAPALQHAGVDTTKTFYVEFVNTQPTNISGDNFELSCRLASSEERPGVRCSQIMTVVYGEKSYHKLFLMKPGCEAWTNLTFSEFYRDGREDDLNFLAADFSQGGNLKLRIENKNVRVILNGVEVYNAQYKLPLGNVYGVKIAFAGVGRIHELGLKDLRTGVEFENGMGKIE